MTRDALSEPVHIRDHAVERFIERVQPGAELLTARVALSRLLDGADFVFEPPDWLARRAKQRAPMYAVIGDVVLPLQPGRDGASLVAVTCLVRGCLSEPARQRRNAQRVQRRRARRRPC